MSKQVLVTLADRNYVPQAKQLFSSVYHNSGWKGDYLLLAHKIPDHTAKWFTDKGILVLPVEPLSKKGFDKHPSTILSKFYLFTPELRRWKKVVFLDGDIIVEASLQALAHIKDFGAVPDIHFMPLGGQFVSPRPNRGDGHKKAFYELERGYDLREVAFNSGMMAFDTGAIEDDALEALMLLYKRYGRISNSEQSILNLYLYKRWQHLPLVYDNYFPYHRPSWKPRYKPTMAVVQHFLWDKPWTRKDRHFDRLWAQNLAMSERIDLGKRAPPARVLSHAEVQAQERFLTKVNGGVGPMRKVMHAAVDWADPMIGKVGRLVRGK